MGYQGDDPMADDSSNSFVLPPSVWIALALSVAGAFVIHQHPFQDARPADAAAPLYRHLPSDDQDVEARLWQDPLAAVAAARLEDTSSPCTRHCQPVTPEHTIAGLNKKMAEHLSVGKSVLVMAAMVSGAPYAEDIETRRRSRFAVHAGLYRSGYVPANSQHLGYVTLAQFYPGEPDAQDLAAYEWFEPEHPFGSAAPQILLLWLDQDGFRDTPLDRVSRIVNSLVSMNPCAAMLPGQVSAVVLGPADSDGLRAMSNELQQAPAKCEDGHALRPLSVYSSRATASDANLLGRLSLPGQDLAAQFEDWSNHLVHLFRTVTTDDVLVGHLWKELQFRGVKNWSQVALVMERDTLYARQMGQYFGGCKSASDPPADAATKQPTCFTYLRGLDGLAPPQPASADSTPAPLSGLLNPTTSNNQPVASEDANGQGQLDYLRRLAASLEPDGRSFRAIGILGSDVYDKLMVLQALRAAYPRAVFFTTDLDARLLQPQNLPWTRQLLIASSLGLSLNVDLQQGTPPFRDTYQTTTYFSTLLALHRFLNPVNPSRADQPPLDAGLQWTFRPRLFEIGRTSAFDLTQDPDRQSVGQAVNTCHWDSDCESIASVSAEGVLSDPSWRTGLRLGLGAALLLLLIVWAGLGTPWIKALVAGCRGDGQHGDAPRRRVIAILILVALISGCTGLWPLLVREFTNHGTRVPASVFGGASLWAAVVFEVISMLAVVTLVIRGQRKLNENAEELHRRFGFAMTRSKLEQWHEDQLKGWRQRLKEWLSARNWACSREALEAERVRVDARAKSAAKDGLSDVEMLVARYLYRGKPAARLSRVAIATLLSTMALIAIEAALYRSLVGANALFGALFGAHSLTVGSAKWIENFISLWSLVFMLFLIIWVADALLLSRGFIQDLIRLDPKWPERATRKVWCELQIPVDQARLWLDLELISLRTAWVTSLIWYPSLVIVAMIVAAITVEFGQFGYADNPVAIIGSTALVVIAALLLRRAAESFRDIVLHKIDDARLYALSPSATTGANLPQLKALFKRVDNMAEGAFAPLSAQPFVRAVLIPLLTYGASALLGYLHLSA
jgi:hypothetical protein